MFGHMVHTIVTRDPQGICVGVDPMVNFSLEEDYCAQPPLLRSTLRAYSLIVGDISLDDYRDSPFITFIWVLFTFFGVIILLNVLIAVVTASYNRSISKRNILFGRARIPILAKHYMFGAHLTNFLHDSPDSCIPIKRISTIFLLVAFFSVMNISSALFVRIIVESPDMFLFDYHLHIFIAVFLFLLIIANIAIITVGLIFLGWKIGASNDNKSACRCIMGMLVVNPMRHVVYSFLGISKSQSDYDTDGEDTLTDIISTRVKEIVENSEIRIKDKLQTFELKMMDSFKTCIENEEHHFPPN